MCRQQLLANNPERVATHYQYGGLLGLQIVYLCVNYDIFGNFFLLKETVSAVSR